jgi:hypothetical protein
MADMIVVNTDFSEVGKVFEMRASGFAVVLDDVSVREVLP